jgi:hypothetical protein
LLVSGDARFVRQFTVYARCTPVPPPVARMRVRSTVRFVFDGTLRDTSGRQIR